MKEMVDPEKLQKALELCVKDYSLFLCVMRVGLFWNFLGWLCVGGCWMHVDSDSSRTSETPESAEKYIMADGIAQWDFFIMEFSSCYCFL